MTTSSPASPSRGFIAGVGAYLLWGFLPLYFPLLEPATPLDISAHRVVWSWVVCLALLWISSRFREYVALMRQPRQVLRLGLAALLLSANWLIFLIGVL
ncbi:MAG TPA: EamA family transporter RarD, partial [Beutenbergiaceae bacterium]|nr:EamA family transporter RarD [Beutenbergiaceae bacterium]